MEEHKNIKWKELIISAAIPLAVGGVSAWLTNDSMEKFSALRQPPLSPPSWLFPVVWTILYAMMGIASYKIYTADVHGGRKKRALTLYAVQLLANFFWTLVFFNLGAYLPAFALLTLLWALIVICIILFYHISLAAARLMIPYALWVSFAAYLNLGIYLLNK